MMDMPMGRFDAPVFSPLDQAPQAPAIPDEPMVDMPMGRFDAPVVRPPMGIQVEQQNRNEIMEGMDFLLDDFAVQRGAVKKVDFIDVPLMETKILGTKVVPPKKDLDILKLGIAKQMLEELAKAEDIYEKRKIARFYLQPLENVNREIDNKDFREFEKEIRDLYKLIVEEGQDPDLYLANFKKYDDKALDLAYSKVGVKKSGEVVGEILQGLGIPDERKDRARDVYNSYGNRKQVEKRNKKEHFRVDQKGVGMLYVDKFGNVYQAFQDTAPDKPMIWVYKGRENLGYTRKEREQKIADNKKERVENIDLVWIDDLPELKDEPVMDLDMDLDRVKADPKQDVFKNVDLRQKIFGEQKKAVEELKKDDEVLAEKIAKYMNTTMEIFDDGDNDDVNKFIYEFLKKMVKESDFTFRDLFNIYGKEFNMSSKEIVSAVKEVGEEGLLWAMIRDKDEYQDENESIPKKSRNKMGGWNYDYGFNPVFKGTHSLYNIIKDFLDEPKKEKPKAKPKPKKQKGPDMDLKEAVLKGQDNKTAKSTTVNILKALDKKAVKSFLTAVLREEDEDYEDYFSDTTTFASKVERMDEIEDEDTGNNFYEIFGEIIWKKARKMANL